jgi:hypothetical protein
MNHRGTETTEKVTEVFPNLAQTALKKYEISNSSIRPLSKISVLLCALCVSVVN